MMEPEGAAVVEGVVGGLPTAEVRSLADEGEVEVVTGLAAGFLEARGGM